jgi:hypothetical protein
MGPRERVTRTLAGHLEDLDLDEIVRVVALSRRSGLLTVDSAEGKAEMTFLGGRLVRVRLHEVTDTLGQVLMRAGLLDDDDLTAPDGVSEGAETLDDVVQRVAEQRGERGLLVQVDDLIRDHMNQLAVRVMLFRTGSFNFRVDDSGTAPLRFPRDTAFTLPAGSDADELARDAKRRRQEKQSDPLSGLGSPARKTTPPSEHIELFLVDDDAGFLSTAERTARDQGVNATSLPTARAAIDRFFALGAGDRPAFMIVDLVMPRSTGKGILGGLEVLKRAADLDLSGRVFLALEDEHEDAVQIARSLGVAGVVKKPSAKKNGSDEPPLAPYLNPVLERLRRAPLAAASFDLARELRDEFGEHSGEWRTDGGRIVDENIRSLETLKALLGELNDPSFHEEIPLLVLRFASAFFVRGALFRVDHKGGEIVGLGAFGLGVADPGRLVRSIKIPMNADTVFARALKERAGVRQPFFDSEWNARLVQALGGPRPRDVYTAPLTSPRGIEALLYADNATDGRPFPDIQLFEIFLQQSGAALERQTLKQELKRLLATA